jgi:hypothetical protein
MLDPPCARLSIDISLATLHPIYSPQTFPAFMEGPQKMFGDDLSLRKFIACGSHIFQPGVQPCLRIVASGNTQKLGWVHGERPGVPAIGIPLQEPIYFRSGALEVEMRGVLQHSPFKSVDTIGGPTLSAIIVFWNI